MQQDSLNLDLSYFEVVLLQVRGTIRAKILF